MGRFAKILTGIAAGAGLMYLLDPQQGKRRRSQAWDQTKKGVRKGTSKAAALGRDAAHRTKGAVIETTRRLRGTKVSDDTLEDRVRAEMGHHVSNASAIEVEADKGRVTLRGAILEKEVENLLIAVRAVPGVRKVDSRLEVFAKPAEHPDLQGARPQPN